MLISCSVVRAGSDANVGRLPRSLRLVIAETAADVDGLRRHWCGQVGDDVADERGDLVRLGVPAQRDLGIETGEHLVRRSPPDFCVIVADALRHWCLRVSGTDRVDRYTGTGEF